MATLSINNLAWAIYESSVGKSPKEMEDIVKNTIEFMNRNHLIGKAPEILKKLEEITDKMEGRVRVMITSKNKLSTSALKDVKEMIEERYEAKEILITEILDKKILGGIKISINDEIIDLTLKNKLNQLEDYLKNA